jgi:hypothetical protein
MRSSLTGLAATNFSASNLNQQIGSSRKVLPYNRTASDSNLHPNTDLHFLGYTQNFEANSRKEP